MSDVYIIGAGIHRFGRTEERSGRDQGVFAVREALKDAGLEWSDICLLYTSPSPRDLSTSRMPSSA